MSFFSELKRRNVFRVGIAYLIIAWLIMQVGEVMAPALHLGGWVLSALAFFLILGLPLALFFAWAFEMTPEGLKRESEVDRNRSTTAQTGRKLDRFIIVVLAIAVIVLVYDRTRDPGITEAPRQVQDVSAETSAERNAIAVLPFQNLSTDEENAFFAAGVHEDILTYLTRIADLRVNSRTSVQQYADSDLNLKQIAAELGAHFIVEGSVRRAGNRVRVTAQLIDAETDEHLWADNFDRELTDIFEIQTAVATEIVAALQATLLPQAETLLNRRPTDSIEAYDLFLKARASMQSTERDNIKSLEGERLLKQALEIDPEYAQAWALLAISHGDHYWFGETRTPKRLELMKQAIDRAAELQPDLPELALARANYYYRGFYDYARALEQLEMARYMLPNDTGVHYFLGLTLRRLGRYDDSIDSFMEAARLDPANTEAWANGIETARYSNRVARAQSMLDRLPALFEDIPRFGAERAFLLLFHFGDVAGAQAALDAVGPSDNYWYVDARFYVHAWAREYRKAVEYALHPKGMHSIAPGIGHAFAAMLARLAGDDREAERILTEGEGLARAELAQPRSANYAWPHMGYARLLVQLGREEEALASCERALQIVGPHNDQVHGWELFIYCTWVKGMAGQVDEALDDLQRILDHGWDLTPWALALDPQWDFLRGNTRFDALATRAETWNSR